MKYTLIITLFILLSMTAQGAVYNILDYVAKPGQLSTKAIQKAIDACHQAGGGQVLVPAGEFITGTLTLKSHLSSISHFKNEPVGVIRNVQFNNIIATSEHGILVYGHEDSPMEKISFENVSLKIVKGRETMAYGGNFDLRPATPIAMQLFEHDIPGLYAYQVNVLSIQDLKLVWGPDLPEFFTHGIEAEHVKKLRFEEFDGGANPGGKNAEKIKLKNSCHVD